jgi:DNA primase
MRIDPKSFDIIKERVRIEEEIAKYVALKAKGTTHKGLCPFHIEKTPSFVVWPATQTFKCMGCGISGDVIGFVKEKESNCDSMSDAAKLLAARYDIPITFLENPDEYMQDGIQEVIIANEFALKIFRANFRTQQAKAAQYWLKDKGYTKDLVNKWEIGYAPLNYAMDYDREILIKADLINEKGYPKFRDRIIFPIRDSYSRLVGFGGRIVDKESNMPKYLNTSETEAYHKRAVLYGLNKNLKRIKKNKYATIVEGYTDVNILERAGIKTAVASCGTSFTSEQAKQLCRHIDFALIMTDGDKAGQKAMVKIIEQLWSQRIKAFPVILPKEHDPASLALEVGNDFADHANKKSAVQILFDYAEGNLGQKTNEVLKSIAQFNNALGRDELLRELTDVSGYHFSSLIVELNSLAITVTYRPQREVE